MQKFPLGNVVATCRVANLMSENLNFVSFVADSICRHSTGDWGTVCPEDAVLNDDALANEGRILSAYECSLDESWKIWIITEWDRSATTILFPDEY